MSGRILENSRLRRKEEKSRERKLMYVTYCHVTELRDTRSGQDHHKYQFWKARVTNVGIEGFSAHLMYR